MVKRFRLQAVRTVVGILAVIASGCGSESGFSPAGASPGFSAGGIEIAPAGAIVGTALYLESRRSFDPSGASLSYSWDFGDGSSGSGEATTHVYATAGVFTATLNVHSSEAGTAQTTLNIPVRSLTARWSGDFGSVSVEQEGLDLRGTYQDGPSVGTVAGRITDTGTVTFTVTSPGLAPVTFKGTAGADVMTLVGSANGRDMVDRPWTLTRG